MSLLPTLAAPRVDAQFVKFAGGLDLVSAATLIQPGYVFDSTNYEIDSINGGYRRIYGYERFDGQTSPSSAQYWLITATITGAFAVGNTVTGQTSGATGKVLRVNASSLVLGRVTGTFVSGENLRVGGITQGVATSAAVLSGAGSVADDTAYTKLAVDDLRADIEAVPGSGPIRGVWLYRDKVYAFRDNAGGTACDMWVESAAGWVQVPFYYEVPFNFGDGPEPATGSTLTQNGVSATIIRVVKRTGSWGDNTGKDVALTLTGSRVYAMTGDVKYSGSANVVVHLNGTQIAAQAGKPPLVEPQVTGGGASGTLVISAVSGGHFAAGAASISGGSTVMLTGAESAIARAPGGRYEFVNHNFTGYADNLRMYGVDGVSTAFEFDGTYLIPLHTGMTTDTPKHIAQHKEHLFLTFHGSLQHSSIGDPYGYSVITGAAELTMGDEITALVEQPGDAGGGTMSIFTLKKTGVLYGSSASDWQLVTGAPGAGAAAYTGRWIGAVFALSQRGIQQVATTLAYGDFIYSAVSGIIQPLVNRLQGTATEAAVFKERNQYRVFFADGTAIAMTVMGSKVVGFLPVVYDVPVRCYVAENRSDGKEYCYFGSDDGYVYRDNIGTSFDGNAIESWLRLPFAHFNSPRYRKRFRKAVLDVVSDGPSSVRVSYELGAGSLDAEPGAGRDITVKGAGGYWDQFYWEKFMWDAPAVSFIEVGLDGTETSLSMLFYGSSATDASFAVQGANFHYSIRRLQR